MGKKRAILAFLILFLASAIVERIAAATPALYAFGDSTTDVGNYFPEDNITYRKPPYGIDYPDGTPTGRASNGFLVVDYIAEAMELPNSPLPFRVITNESETDIGVNFASGGSGVLNTTRQYPNVITLDEQIEDFKKIAANLTARIGEQLASIQLAQSLFYLSAGSNDLFQEFFDRRPANSTEKHQIVASIIIKFTEQLQTLHKLGARKFAVLSTGPIGCTPVARVFSSLTCLDGLNDLSMRFKKAVKIMLEYLSVTLEGFKYSFTDAYEVGTQVNANPSAYGFREIKAACCGDGILGIGKVCSENTTYCNNRTQYVFWDLLHPTQELYSLLAQVALKGSPTLVAPVNVSRLILTSGPNCIRRGGTAVA